MKTYKNNNTKLALLAGAATLATLTLQVHAQSSDALLDKLVDKGILTADEAKDLRVESDRDFKTAFQAKTGMPDWVSGYKLSGDVRGRFEQFSGDNAALIDRTRFRYRVRVGLAVNLLDNLEAGLRLSSADATKIAGATVPTGNPVSGNSTMQDNFTKKGIFVDAAYGKWTPINSAGWLVAATVGKMDNPFTFTPMVFDPDITPEGAALTGGYAFNDKHSVSFVGAAFVMDEVSTTTQDPFMYGGQIAWNAKWNDKWASSIGVGGLAIVNSEQLTTANVPYVNQGNSRYVYIPAGTSTSVIGLSYRYTPMIADASVTWTLDSFPLYAGAFPIKFAGEVMNNPAAPKNNNGFWVGATLGKSGTKKTWDLSYRYEYLEADAWYDQMADDDIGAFYAPSAFGATSANYANTTASAGWYGGTNVKGHLIKFNYSIYDGLTFSVSCFINELIILPSQSSTPVDLNSSAIHFMADLMWKF